MGDATTLAKHTLLKGLGRGIFIRVCSLWILALSLLLAVACGTPVDPSRLQRNTTSPAPNSTAPSSTALMSAPDFEVTLYQGEKVLRKEKFRLSELRGKPLVLNFYAGLCPPCRAEMPDFQRVYEQYDDRFLLLGVDIGPFVGLGSREDGRMLLEDLSITYPAGTTSDQSVPARYEILGMPTTVFITSQGGIHRKWAGLLPRDRMAAFVEELLKASGL
ncbi:MAG: TlpA family protein disulfide reductase [Chloroflexi bacterium]|nr:TlpA family protein disulfide reductase [Chloroflexota bacterium]